MTARHPDYSSVRKGLSQGVRGSQIPFCARKPPPASWIPLCQRAVEDRRAAAAGLPPVDGLDVWPLISGANATSPRTEIPLCLARVEQTSRVSWDRTDAPRASAGTEPTRRVSWNICLMGRFPDDGDFLIWQVGQPAHGVSPPLRRLLCRRRAPC